MNVIVVPDASMIVIPLIEKNGHTYLSPSNFSRYDNMDICEGNLTFDNLISKYSSSELPSGVKSRLFLFSKVVEKADAAIIIGKRPKYHERMYDSLNDLILFGGNACNNARNLETKIIQDLNIPTLKLAYPTNQTKLIELIDKTNYFLKNLENIGGIVNDDGLTIDSRPKREKYPISDVKNLLDNLI
jgi:putative methanogenesis marker protein 5